MESIFFTDEDTNEEIEFFILSATKYEEESYLLLAEKDVYEEDEDEVEAYVMKAAYDEGEDVIYEIIEDQALLDIVYPILEEKMDDFE